MQMLVKQEARATLGGDPVNQPRVIRTGVGDRRRLGPVKQPEEAVWTPVS